MTTSDTKFSGYLMAALAAVIFFAVMGIGYITLSLYLPSLVAEMDANVGIISVMFGVLSATSMICSFASGAVVGKIGIQKVIMIGVAGILLGYIVLCLSTNIYMVFAAAALAGVGLSWSGTICVGNVVPNWFIDKQGTMVGLVVASCGVGGLVGSPTISWIMSLYGWRTACLVTVVFMTILLVPASLLIKGKPADVGQVPLGYRENTDSETQELPGISFNVANKTGTFWLLVLMFVAFSMLVSGLNPHVANFIQSKPNFDIVFAGTIVAVFSVTNIIGSILLGTINDRLGTKAAVVFSAAAGLLCLVFMMFADTTAVAITFAVFFGLANPAAGALVPLIIGPCFGYKAFPQLLGIYNGVVAFTGIVAPIIIGVLVTMTDAYTLAIWILLACVVIALTMGLLGIAASKKLMRQQ
ncbi:MAG: MFS transporter [Coriobacteriales bacterium]|jgi:MFS family permease|nr:MFS transporter [Coriobacteriales bacterium]